MVRARSALVLVLMASAAVACGGGNKKKQPAKPVAKKQTTKKKAKPAPAPPVTDAAPNLAVDDDLVAKCKIPIDNKIKAPKFDYDRFELLQEDRDVLDIVAGCVKDGPFAGRGLVLVGHTDNAGTVEYNLALGSKRASTVGDYLERQGVPSKQIGVTTRGETDAEGSDNDTRRVDRRVDITLEREKEGAAEKDKDKDKEDAAPKEDKTEKTEKKDKKDKKADKKDEDKGGF